MILAKVWYFLTSGGSAFLLPYLNVYFDSTLHFSKEQIGALSALRPWLSAPCAVLLCTLADRLNSHTALLVFTFAASVLLRCLLLFVPAHFLAVAALVLLSDCIGAPVGAIVDATVVGACPNDGDYGKHRMWASVGWGGLSVVAGWLVATKGLGAGMMVYFIMSFPCVFVALKLRRDASTAAAAGTGSAAKPADSAAAAAGADKQAVAQADSPAAGLPAGRSSSKGAAGRPPPPPPPAAAAADYHLNTSHAADPDEYTSEDLMARLLPGSPNSHSSCGGSYAGSSCDGSRTCTPEPGLVMRCGSPFSKFAASPFGQPEDSSSFPAAPAAAAAGLPGPAVVGDAAAAEVGSPAQRAKAQQQSRTAMAAAGQEQCQDDMFHIKAWYQQEEEQQDADRQLPAAAAAAVRDGVGFVPGPGERQLNAETAEAAAAAAAAGPAAAAAAGPVTQTAGNGAIVVVSTKRAAKLSFSDSLQPTYSQLDLQTTSKSARDDSDNDSLAVAAAAAATGATAIGIGSNAAAQHIGTCHHDEAAPLLDLCSKQPVPTVPAAAEQAAAAQGASGVTIRSLLMQPAVLVFMWRALIIGLGLGTIGNFLFLHVEELGGTGNLMGVMLAFNCLTEVPAFHFQSFILAKLPVHFVFNASMLLLAVRLAGYGCLPWLHSPWPVLGLELLHGCTFASSWGAGIVHCKRLAPPHLNASMQGLFSSLYGGLGSGLGALLGGVLMQELGGQGLFFICSLIVLTGWLVGAAVEMLLGRLGKTSVQAACGSE